MGTGSPLPRNRAGRAPPCTGAPLRSAGGSPSSGQTKPGSLEGPPGRGAVGRGLYPSPSEPPESRLRRQMQCGTAGAAPQPSPSTPKTSQIPQPQNQTQYPTAWSSRGSSSPAQSPRPTNFRSCFLTLSLMSPAPVGGPGTCWPCPSGPLILLFLPRFRLGRPRG